MLRKFNKTRGSRKSGLKARKGGFAEPSFIFLIEGFRNPKTNKNEGKQEMFDSFALIYNNNSGHKVVK